MAHSPRLQHNNTCNLINPLDGGWSSLNLTKAVASGEQGETKDSGE